MKTKVKALTLNEMVIVMIITTIVMGLTFTVLSLVQRHMWSIQQNFNFNTELNRLEEALWIDTNNYNSISYHPKVQTLKFKTAMDSTTYQFKKDYTLKDKDTFYIAIANRTWFFNGREITGGKLDAMRLELSKAFMNQQLFVFKANDAKQFLD